MSLELRMGEDVFRAVVAGGAIDAARARRPSPTRCWSSSRGRCSPSSTAGSAWSTRIASGELAIDGDREAVERFVGLFPLPEPAAVPA